MFVSSNHNATNNGPYRQIVLTSLDAVRRLDRLYPPNRNAYNAHSKASSIVIVIAASKFDCKFTVRKGNIHEPAMHQRLAHQM
eukprot:4908184-Amphidinium_carterae.1